MTGFFMQKELAPNMPMQRALPGSENHLLSKNGSLTEVACNADGTSTVRADDMDDSLRDPLPTLSWVGDTSGTLRLIDQTLLPLEERLIDCTTVEQLTEAIQSLCVRGAPAIGVAAAYGVVLGMQSYASASRDRFDRRLDEVAAQLASSRPTAVNLFTALKRMQKIAADNRELSSRELHEKLLAEARQIENEDREMCVAIGRVGAELLAENSGVLTHCNAGGLATAGEGTALSVIFTAVAQGKTLHVYADETRPLLQGARLTAWELMRRDIRVTLICDSTAGWVMQQGRVQAVVTGADRIAANGDTANKIGTYSLALLARDHGIPFYVAAPTSTFDLSLSTGAEIPIEERAGTEITAGFGRQTAPENVAAYNPAFDVTPAACITAIICERGLIRPVKTSNIAEVLG
jgi:methylthioribose-1-phosphate isomerase